MHSFLASTRRCATCRWWEGERIADRAAGAAHTPCHAATGRCRSPVGWWTGRLKQAESTCEFWRPWENIHGPLPGRAGTEVVMLGPPMAYPVYPRYQPR
jgi:hypothetical protein